MQDGMHPCDVCIVCALAEETDAVLVEFSRQCQVAFEKKVDPSSGYVYHWTAIQNQKGEQLSVLLSCQTYPGPVETTNHLTSLLNDVRPRFLAMAGLCAGDKQRVMLGDLVVAECAYHYEQGKVERMEDGTLAHQPEPHTYGPAKRILQYVHGFKTWQAANQRQTDTSVREPRCFVAPMASGMAVRSDDPFSLLQQQHRKTLALDQEAAAFYKTLQEEFPDVSALVVKGVCDYADDAKNDAYREEAAHISARYLLAFIQEYVTSEAMPGRRDQDQRWPVVQIRSNHIAAPPGKMFDRTKELAEIQRCLLDERETRGIFLWGGRGCGKSILAKKIVEDCLAVSGPLGKRFTHVVWLTFRNEELTTTGIARPYNVNHSKQEIYAEILDVHGLSYLGNTHPLKGVQEVLRTTRTLVVLDSFEFFLEAKEELDSDLAALLSEVAPGSCFLLTSSCNSDEIRRYGYKVLQVIPFDAATARDYFLSRWNEKSVISSSAQWDDEIHTMIFAATVGIPLALELVSHYVHDVEDVRAVLEDINRRTHPLWEYIYKQALQKLQQDERRLLLMTMVFKSPLEREWLRKAVRFDEKRYRVALTHLRYHGLLDMNHLYIHETLREYLISHEEYLSLMGDVQHEFIDWAVGFAKAYEKWEVNSQQERMFASNLHNLIAALEMVLSREHLDEQDYFSFATAVAHYLHISGRWHESEKFLKALLGKQARDMQNIRVQVLLGRHYAHQEKTRTALSYLLPALKKAETLGNETLRAEVCLRLGQTFHRKDPQHAWRYLQEAHTGTAGNASYDSLRTRISTLSYMAEIRLLAGQAEEALVLLADADRELQRLEWDRVRAHHARLKADAYLHLNNREMARKYYDESRHLAENGADGRLLAWNYLGLAELENNLDYAIQARELFAAVGLQSQVKRAKAVIKKLASL